MYTEHPVFIQPHNENIKIWKYMDFTKFFSMLDSNSLYFSRSDKLGDPFEGSWPRRNITARKLIPHRDIPAPLQQKLREAQKLYPETMDTWRRFVALNCWHMNNNESAAMWKLYLKSNEGIAVQSTFQRLKESITSPEIVYLGVVNYLDYNKDSIDESNIFYPYVHKRKAFEYEKEIRGLVARLPTRDFNERTIKDGIYIEVELNRLVERIYLGPGTPGWIRDLVESVIGLYNYDFELAPSSLDEKPVF